MMAKGNNNSRFSITKPEVRFWLVIIGLVVTGVVAFTKLQGQVNAFEDRATRAGSSMSETVKIQNELLLEVNERTIRMEKDIEFIKEHTE